MVSFPVNQGIVPSIHQTLSAHSEYIRRVYSQNFKHLNLVHLESSSLCRSHETVD
jgi:hypothetical protein